MKAIKSFPGDRHAALAMTWLLIVGQRIDCHKAINILYN